MNANEHYVSQVLLRRFTIAGHLQSYSLKEDKWRRLSPKKVFSELGYNQLLIDGQVDNTLEQAFSKVETHLPKTLEALEKAADNASTELPAEIFENLCWYCAFIKRISLFAKAAAPADFVIQLDKELEQGTPRTLYEVLNFPEEIVQFYRREHALGRRVIIYSYNFLQTVYRIQFRRKYALDYSTFRHNTIWTVCKSPIELPVADVAMTEIPVKVHNSIFYGLPIGRNLLLKGQIKWGEQAGSTQTIVKGYNLTLEEAELWFEAICLSAVTELVSAQKIPDILDARSRAKAKGIAFTKIVNPDMVISAGLKNFTSDFGLVVVPSEEYVKFIHSFVQPPDK
ncbi:MAG TPA: DUF4238 domain-containing protein [Verrucomicrobiae bacterium]|jgi:hypothetical protein|nr:DUF4238 domain-containing protein [Verrucomicrobiae bacterium]